MEDVNLILRGVKGSPLTTAEMDNNLLIIQKKLKDLYTVVQTADEGVVRPVDGLPQIAAEDDVVFNLKDNNLYRYAKGAWVKMVQEVTSTVVIADNSITTPKLAAGSVTAQKMAVNSITAGNAAIAQAAVGTLSIAGNAVTLCQTAKQITQKEVNTVSYVDMLTTTVTLTGLQPLLLWCSYSYGGAHVGTASDYNDYYMGNYWKYNTKMSGQDVRFCLKGANTYYTDEMGGISVGPGNGFSGSAMGVLTGVAAGTYTLSFQVKKTAAGIENTWVRNIFLALLETKR